MKQNCKGLYLTNTLHAQIWYAEELKVEEITFTA